MAQDIRASRPLQQCKKQVASYNFACAVLRSSGFFPASQSLKKNKTSCQLHRRSSPMPAKIGWHGECHPYVARRLGLGSSSMKQGPMIPNQKLQCKSRCPCLLAQKNFLGGSWDFEVVLLCSLPSAAKTFLLCNHNLQPHLNAQAAQALVDGGPHTVATQPCLEMWHQKWCKTVYQSASLRSMLHLCYLLVDANLSWRRASAKAEGKGTVRLLNQKPLNKNRTHLPSPHSF